MLKVRGAAAIEVLKEHLLMLPPGDISVPGSIGALLAGCWNEFAGSGFERMQAGKLGRMEDVFWQQCACRLSRFLFTAMPRLR